MVNPEIERYIKKLIKTALILLLLVTVYFAIAYFIPITVDVFSLIFMGLLPFILAIVVAVLIDPLVNWLESRKIKRGFAVLIALVLLTVLISLILFIVISRLVIELSELYQLIPFYTQNIYSYILDILEVVRNYLSTNPLPAEAQNAISNSMNTVIDKSASMISVVINFLFALITGLPGLFTILIISSLATFFISRDKVRLMQGFYKLIPEKYIASTNKIKIHLSSVLVGFLRAELILISISAVLSIIGLNILGAKYAFTVGMVVGLLDILPIIGPGALYLPWAIIMIVFGNIKFGVGLLILYAIVSVVRQTTEPKILSQNIGLNPLAVLAALYLGLNFFGVAGFIIGPVIFILIKTIYTSWHID